jgi:hypothetical protein
MMRKLLSNGLVIAGMLTVPVAVTNTEVPDAKTEYRNDPRLDALKKFFQASDCPAQDFPEEFLRAADRHNLDWRLLPSLSVIESGGGRAARNNNLFGWDNGRAIFASFRAGIHDVAGHLANSKLYRDKDLDHILQMYNPDVNYPGVVKSVMRRISPTEEM